MKPMRHAAEIKAGIRIGDKTQNQGQSITPHSFSTMSETESNPVVPTPQELFSFFICMSDHFVKMLYFRQ